MAFNGHYKLQRQRNFASFMKAIGIADDLIERGKYKEGTSEIIETGDYFKITVTAGSEVLVNEFVIGQETEVDSPTGDKIKIIIKREGKKKLVTKIQNITSVTEVTGDQLVNITAIGDIAYKRISKRVRMDFSGRYELQSQENVELFMEALGVPDDMIEKIKGLKRVTKVVQNGEDFIVAIQTGEELLINNFTLGQETQMQTPTGEKIRATMNLEGGNKLVVKARDFTSIAEFDGDQLTNTITFGNVVFKQISKKITEPDVEEDACSSL
ncbi:uncharacterized protein LOC119963868 isoform X1 [Scyliorhinus canicula]|uniref:uncharacterized protein LOC119963868 isoform X1 n=1 Tax=Scyliorhinus canicula TaxID=7830 RepID=UPI0018F66CE4|nr:uncharacterized protein LOC119963868 isoform X1 [Scyliorhinus canicula]